MQPESYNIRINNVPFEVEIHYERAYLYDVNGERMTYLPEDLTCGLAESDIKEYDGGYSVWELIIESEGCSRKKIVVWFNTSLRLIIGAYEANNSYYGYSDYIKCIGDFFVIDDYEIVDRCGNTLLTSETALSFSYGGQYYFAFLNGCWTIINGTLDNFIPFPERAKPNETYWSDLDPEWLGDYIQVWTDEDNLLLDTSGHIFAEGPGCYGHFYFGGPNKPTLYNVLDWGEEGRRLYVYDDRTGACLYSLCNNVSGKRDFFLPKSESDNRELYRIEDYGRYGIINNLFEIVLRPIYSSVEIIDDYMCNEKEFLSFIIASDIWISGKCYRRYGIINEKRELVVPMANERIDYMGGGCFLLYNSQVFRDFGQQLIYNGYNFYIFATQGSNNDRIIPLSVKKCSYDCGSYRFIICANVVKEGLFGEGSEQRALGVINDSGKIIVGFEYEDIRFLYIDKDLLVVSQKGKYGLLRISDNKIIIPLEYDALQIKNGLVSVVKNGKKGLLFLNGEILIPPIYSDIIDDRIPQHDGISRCPIEYEGHYMRLCQNGLWGYFDLDRFRTSNMLYKQAYIFALGFAAVLLPNEDVVSFIDGEFRATHPKDKDIEKYWNQVNYSQVESWQAEERYYKSQAVAEEEGRRQMIDDGLREAFNGDMSNMWNCR